MSSKCHYCGEVLNFSIEEFSVEDKKACYKCWQNNQRTKSVGKSDITENKVCSSCGAYNKATAKFCNSCASPLSSGYRKCPLCGEENSPLSRFCGMCASPLEETKEEPESVMAHEETLANEEATTTENIVEIVESSSDERYKEYEQKCRDAGMKKVITAVVALVVIVTVIFISINLFSPTGIAKRFFYAFQNGNYSKAASMLLPEQREGFGRTYEESDDSQPEIKIDYIETTVNGDYAEVKLIYSQKKGNVGGYRATVGLEKRNGSWLVSCCR